MISLDVIRWVSLVVLMAVWLIVHFTLVVRTARMPGLTPLQRVMTVVLPPLTPIFGYRLGAKRRAVLWWALVVAYGVARMVQ